jgi:hypothetical protein
MAKQNEYQKPKSDHQDVDSSANWLSQKSNAIDKVRRIVNLSSNKIQMFGTDQSLGDSELLTPRSTAKSSKVVPKLSNIAS